MFRSMSKGKVFAIAVLFGFLGFAVWQMTGQFGDMSQICGGVGLLYLLVFLVKVRRDMKLAGRPVQRATTTDIPESASEQPRKGRYYVPEND